MKTAPPTARIALILTAVLIAWLAVVTRAQGPPTHPTKAAFADAASWPAVAPGAVELAHFQPFRAVYRRNYKQGAGPNRGAPRTDRLIVHAEAVAWDGEPAIAILLIDSGIVGKADTNARTHTSFVARDDLSLLFETGPIPGQGKDYYLMHRLADKLVGTMVMTAAGESQKQERPVGQPGFGPAIWAIANAGLEAGKRVRIEPVHSLPSNPVTGFSAIAEVIGKETFVAGDGTRRDAWLVRRAGNLASPRTPHDYLIDRPPYYLGTVMKDLDSGEAEDFLRLETFQTFAP